MVDTVQSAIYKMGADTAQYVSAMNAADQANQKVVASTEQVTVSEERVTVAARSTADAYTRLTARYDPLIRAEQQRAAAMEREARIAEELGIEESRRAATIGRINAVYDTQIARLSGVAANTNIAGRSYRNFGSIVQQAGFQIGDFAVQVASGQNALRAFIQQGTQILQFFGPWGSIIGAAGAVVGALAISYFDLGNAADSASEDQDKFNDTLERASALMDEINGKAERTRASLLAERENLIGIAELAVRNAEAQVAAAEARIRFLQGAASEKATQQRLKNDLTLTDPRAAAAAAGTELTVLRATLGEFDDGRSRLGQSNQDLIEQLNREDKRKAEEAQREAERRAKEADRETERLHRDAGQRVSSFARELSTVQARIDPVAAATLEYARAQDVLNEAYDRGLLFTEEYYASLDKLAEVYKDKLDPAAAAARKAAEEEAQKAARTEAERLRRQLEANEASAQQLVGTLTSGFGDVASSIAQAGFNLQTLGDIGTRVLNSLIDQFIQLAYVNPLNNALGVNGGNAPTLASVGTNLFGSILGAFSSGSVAGTPATGSGMGRMYGRFADGGDFDVAGAGGTDSQLVQFMATPGERVSVRTPQQVSNDNRSSNRVTQHFHFPPASNGFGYSPYQIAQRAAERAARSLR
jgi:hypothetical protein